MIIQAALDDRADNDAGETGVVAVLITETFDEHGVSISPYDERDELMRGHGKTGREDDEDRQRACV